MYAHKTVLLSAITTALLTSVSLQAAEPLKAVGAGEGQLDIVAWPGGYIERGESDKAYDWVHRFREGNRLQGQCENCRYVRRNGQPDDQGRLRPGHRLGRRLVAADCRQARAAGQHRADPQLEKPRPAPQGCTVVRGQPADLRHPVPVGPERADVQHRRVQAGARQMEACCSAPRTCPTASRTKAACKPTMARSTSPTQGALPQDRQA